MLCDSRVLFISLQGSCLVSERSSQSASGKLGKIKTGTDGTMGVYILHLSQNGHMDLRAEMVKPTDSTLGEKSSCCVIKSEEKCHRIMEGFGLGGTLKIIQTTGRDTFH